MKSFENHKRWCEQSSFIIALIPVVIMFLPILYFNYTDIDDYVFIGRLHANYNHINIKAIFFPTESFQYYRPVLECISYIDYGLWGVSNRGFHLTNYLFHVLNSALVFFITRHFVRDNCFQYWPTCAMLLFAFHPLVCESVAWISGRSDIFGTFFSLLAILFYFKAKTKYYGMALIFVFLGLLSKENALAVIPILWVIHLYFMKQLGRHLVSEGFYFALLLSVPFIIYLLMRTNGFSNHDYSTVQAAAGSMNLSVEHGSIFRHFYTLMASVGFYVKKLIWPYPLNFAISTINYPAYFIFSLFLILLSAVWLIKKAYYLLVGLIVICLSFLPALLVVAGGIAWVPYAERYLYLSSAVFAVVLGMAFKRYMSKRNSAIIISVILCVFSVSTLNRVFIWSSSSSLWADTYKKNPLSSKVLYKYAKTLGPEKGFEYHKLAVARDYNDSSRDSWKDLSYLAIARYEVDHGNIYAAVEAINMALESGEEASNYNVAAGLMAHIADSKEIKGTEQEKQYLIKSAVYYHYAYNINHEPFSGYYAGLLFLRADNLKQARELFELTAKSNEKSKYSKLSLIKLKKIDSGLYRKDKNGSD